MLTVVYFHPLNPYPGALEFLGALDGTMTLGFASAFAYSTLTLVAFVALKGFGAKHVSQKCRWGVFLKTKLP